MTKEQVTKPVESFHTYIQMYGEFNIQRRYEIASAPRTQFMAPFLYFELHYSNLWNDVGEHVRLLERYYSNASKGDAVADSDQIMGVAYSYAHAIPSKTIEAHLKLNHIPLTRATNKALWAIKASLEETGEFDNYIGKMKEQGLDVESAWNKKGTIKPDEEDLLAIQGARRLNHYLQSEQSLSEVAPLKKILEFISRGFDLNTVLAYYKSNPIENEYEVQSTVRAYLKGEKKPHEYLTQAVERLVLAEFRRYAFFGQEDGDQRKIDLRILHFCENLFSHKLTDIAATCTKDKNDRKSIAYSLLPQLRQFFKAAFLLSLDNNLFTGLFTPENAELFALPAEVLSKLDPIVAGAEKYFQRTGLNGAHGKKEKIINEFRRDPEAYYKELVSFFDAYYKYFDFLPNGVRILLLKDIYIEEAINYAAWIEKYKYFHAGEETIEDAIEKGTRLLMNVSLAMAGGAITIPWKNVIFSHKSKIKSSASTVREFLANNTTA